MSTPINPRDLRPGDRFVITSRTPIYTVDRVESKHILSTNGFIYRIDHPDRTFELVERPKVEPKLGNLHPKLNGLLDESVWILYVSRERKSGLPPFSTSYVYGVFKSAEAAKQAATELPDQLSFEWIDEWPLIELKPKPQVGMIGTDPTNGRQYFATADPNTFFPVKPQVHRTLFAQWNKSIIDRLEWAWPHNGGA